MESVIKKNILLVCYGGGHVAMMLPLIKVIQENSYYSLSIFALTTAGAVLKNEGIDYVSYKDFTYLVDGSFSDIGASLTGAESVNSVVPYAESVAYHGINYLDLVLQYDETEAENRYQRDGRQIFYPIHFMKILLSKLCVDLVITTNSPRTEQAAIDAAGLLGIKSVCMIDLFAEPSVSWIGKPNYASKLCVLNPSVKSVFIKAGRKVDDVIVTGNPAFDSLTNDETITEGTRIKHDRGWDYDSVVTILYASQVESRVHPSINDVGDPELPRHIENKLRDLISKDKRYRLVVRYHPSENIEPQSQERVAISPKTEKLHPLLHAIDIVIVMTSTVGLEAYLIGKPVITVEMSMFSSFCPYAQMGVSSGVSNFEMLEAKINELRDYVLKAKSTSCNLDKLDATANVIKVIDDLMSED